MLKRCICGLDERTCLRQQATEQSGDSCADRLAEREAVEAAAPVVPQWLETLRAGGQL